MHTKFIALASLATIVQFAPAFTAPIPSNANGELSVETFSISLPSGPTVNTLANGFNVSDLALNSRHELDERGLGKISNIISSLFNRKVEFEARYPPDIQNFLSSLFGRGDLLDPVSGGVFVTDLNGKRSIGKIGNIISSLFNRRDRPDLDERSIGKIGNIISSIFGRDSRSYGTDTVNTFPPFLGRSVGERGIDNIGKTASGPLNRRDELGLDGRSIRKASNIIPSVFSRDAELEARYPPDIQNFLNSLFGRGNLNLGERSTSEIDQFISEVRPKAMVNTLPSIFGREKLSVIGGRDATMEVVSPAD
ncbi:hypothetical protein K488DRAFT_70847 [Vararia minispora EC-137]|uniref:Uncharacterized protein n=1 Tax=Vararia minispora EC-137 TaxID=1314806 RepID=A0ACB8QJW2_9AGAM|nr:hypothetical protein K488DRAFT_70847 [Vararia minispora EC-137]